MKDILKRLMYCFPNSFINQNYEFIAHKETNQYFSLDNCENELDIKCKLLEWFSRPAYKTEPYSSKKKNNELHSFMADGVNEFLDTNFNEKDFELVYTYLGNACNHKRTIKFIESGYDMNVLKESD